MQETLGELVDMGFPQRLTKIRKEKGLTQQALADYTLAVEKAPEQAKGYWLRGRLLLSEKRTKEAIRDFERGLKCDPGHAGLKRDLEEAQATPGGS